MSSVQAEYHSAYPHEKSNILSHALDALQRGWSVIPLIGGDDARRGKRPAIRWQKYQHTCPAEDIVHEWFADGEKWAYGVVCGNGLIVIDFDDTDQQVRFMQQFPELLETRIVQSGGRGLWHLYFVVDFQVKSQKLNGVDLQSDGRYVVGAGSRIAGGEWKLVSDQPVKSLDYVQLQQVIAFLDPVEQTQRTREATIALSSNAVLTDYVSLYRAKTIEFKGRNDALFYTGCQMRDAGYSQIEVLQTLVDAHVRQPAIGSHASESEQQRHKEAERTIQSVFSRLARQRLSQPQSKKEEASYLPNALREAVLQYDDGGALLRTIEALILKDVKAGDILTEREMLELLSGDVGRYSIRKALKFSPSPGPRSHAGADTATLTGTTNTCVFVPAPKPDKSPAHRPPQPYIMPGIPYLCEIFGVESTGSDPITIKDVSSIKKYRSALNRELIKRRPGKYTQKWLGNRLNVSRTTIQRYINEEPIKSRWLFEGMRLTWKNVHQIPTGPAAEEAGIAIRHCFLQDNTRKRYPPKAGLARKLLKEGRDVWLMVRICKTYRVEEEVIQPKYSFDTGKSFEKMYFHRIDYELSDYKPPVVETTDTEDVRSEEADTAEESRSLFESDEAIEPASKPEEEKEEKRSPRYYRRPLPDNRDEYTAQKLYKTCEGKLRREEARKLVEVYGRTVVGRARWWMEQLMEKGKVENPPGFFKTQVRLTWMNLHGTLPPPYKQPPKRKPRKKPYDLYSDPIWQSESYCKWRMEFLGEDPWEMPPHHEELDF